MSSLELLSFLCRIINRSIGHGMSIGIPLGLQYALELEDLVMLLRIL